MAWRQKSAKVLPLESSFAGGWWCNCQGSQSEDEEVVGWQIVQWRSLQRCTRHLLPGQSIALMLRNHSYIFLRWVWRFATYIYIFRLRLYRHVFLNSKWALDGCSGCRAQVEPGQPSREDQNARKRARFGDSLRSSRSHDNLVRIHTKIIFKLTTIIHNHSINYSILM